MPAREVGEICIKGPQVGCLDTGTVADETEKVNDQSDRLFPLRRHGHLDEAGYTKISTQKTMILVSGSNVYPKEIEEFAVSHPGILEAAAVAVRMSIPEKP